MINVQKITIVKTRKPVEKNINQELQWFCSSLGLFSLRDKDRSCFRIFIELLKNTKKSTPVSSDKIAHSLDLSRGTVVHHLNKLMDAGIIIVRRNKYLLRVDNLKELVKELKKDIIKTCNELENIAEKIDKRLGL